MAMPLDKIEIKYSTPLLKKGKDIVGRKTEAKLSEYAGQDWYIEYYLTDPSMNLFNKRVKVREDMNKIKNYHEKETYANDLLININELLSQGLHQYNGHVYQQVMNDVISLYINEAVDKYSLYLYANGTRKKSVQTYLSKLKYFSEYYPQLKVNAVTGTHVHNFLKAMQLKNNWETRTRNAAKVILNGFFNFLIRSEFIKENPVKHVETQKSVTKSNSHKVFSDEHLKAIMIYLKENDPFTSLFVKSIYYMCIRPKELRQLRLGMISLKTKSITIPAEIAKNKKTQSVVMDPAFIKEIEELEISSYQYDNYLFASSGTIIGSKPVGENTPYDRFMKCLQKLGIADKGYTLYSFKHTSTVKKYLDGWTVAEIMKSNRHASISETENYLRDLSQFVDISQKSVPTI